MAVWLSVLYCAIFCHYFGQVSAIFLPLREYSGSTFFDAWDFYGNIDNTTWGEWRYGSSIGLRSNSFGLEVMLLIKTGPMPHRKG